MALPVATIIAVAKTSQYLAANDIAKGSLFGARKIPITPQILRIEREIIEYVYNLDPTESNLRLTANYLLSLCRGYNLQALNIVNTGSGGGVSPIAPSTSIQPYDFVVDASTSFIIDGQSVKQFPARWIGFNILFYRGGQIQSTVNGGGTYYSWDSANAILTLLGNPSAAVTGETFQIYATI